MKCMAHNERIATPTSSVRNDGWHSHFLLVGELLVQAVALSMAFYTNCHSEEQRLVATWESHPY